MFDRSASNTEHLQKFPSAAVHRFSGHSPAIVGVFGNSLLHRVPNTAAVGMNTLIPTAVEPPGSLKLLLRPVEAANALGISPRTLWTLAERGEIPRIRIGRAVAFSVESLRAFIARKEQEGAGDEPK